MMLGKGKKNAVKEIPSEYVETLVELKKQWCDKNNIPVEDDPNESVSYIMHDIMVLIDQYAKKTGDKNEQQ